MRVILFLCFIFFLSCNIEPNAEKIGGVIEFKLINAPDIANNHLFSVLAFSEFDDPSTDLPVASKTDNFIQANMTNDLLTFPGNTEIIKFSGGSKWKLLSYIDMNDDYDDNTGDIVFNVLKNVEIDGNVFVIFDYNKDSTSIK